MLDDTEVIVLATPLGDGEAKSLEERDPEGITLATLRYVTSHIEVSEVLVGDITAELNGDRLEVVSYELIELEGAEPIVYDDVRERVLQPGTEYRLLLARDALPDRDVLRPRAALSDAANEAGFVATGCAQKYNTALDDALEAFDLPANELVLAWAAANPPPGTLSEYSRRLRDHLVAAEEVREQDRNEAAWAQTDPKYRSLQPNDAPRTVRDRLKSTLVLIDIVDMSRETAVGIRTDTGASLLMPETGHADAYFTPTDDAIYFDKVNDWAAMEPDWSTTIAEVDIAELNGYAAVQILGTMDAPVIKLLTEAELNERFELDAKALPAQVEEEE